ncbi:MAG: ornithine aminomutase [Acidaminobacter sp.]|uniref:ornithine aminomutase subunit alpha n=1 Tax=Acidaminobacter sp. TaxID=1872102 RepID=UPI0013825602|nr:ornithine aminomutase subunit alpha [Acidaminobacter sp.]MZQ98998.1 ornithine aminomutase [Acidaminobacter sp.]
MKGSERRADDFESRREHLKNMTDEQLKDYFWQLTEKVVDPLLELARTHTTPSVERSVLLRMGFSSLEAKPLVEGAIDRGLIGHGTGNVIYRIAKEKNLSVREAGLALIEGKFWDDAVTMFKGGNR